MHTWLRTILDIIYYLQSYAIFFTISNVSC